MADLNTRIFDFLWKNLAEKHVTGKKDPFWNLFAKQELISGLIPAILRRLKQTGRLK